jgi:hypothetical protein
VFLLRSHLDSRDTNQVKRVRSRTTALGWDIRESTAEAGRGQSLPWT